MVFDSYVLFLQIYTVQADLVIKNGICLKLYVLRI